ncbi:uncharacterized protein LOC111628510 [Centruroides sculpturatus]|uniref:uncharacterized protein LOC111628510 n=1 Tax=Centruroides sculpturatus TaxID=218467 RepID=UPI000C6CBB6C|nr:uncharacterized protein LOC111628510 [Centruroides sculpturatus]
MKTLNNIYEKVKKQLNSLDDAMVLAIHCQAIDKMRYFVGVGKDWPSKLKILKPHELPKEWNSNQDRYFLRYVDDNKDRFLLDVFKSDLFNSLFVFWIDVRNNDSNIIDIERFQYAGKELNSFPDIYKEDVFVIREKIEHLILTPGENNAGPNKDLTYLTTFNNIFNNVKEQLTSLEDAIVLALHCETIDKMKRFVGIGKEWPSELKVLEPHKLPKDWNANQDRYFLRYMDDNNDLLLLDVIKSKIFNSLFIFWINVNNNNCNIVSIEISDYCRKRIEQFPRIYFD